MLAISEPDALRSSGHIYSRLNRELFTMDARPARVAENRLLTKACQIAANSQEQNFRVGALIVDRGCIVSSAPNECKTHPMQKYWGHRSGIKIDSHRLLLHAEIAALVSLRCETVRPTVVVARINNNGEPRCSYPCRICLPALKHAGVRRIICYDVVHQPIVIDL